MSKRDLKKPSYAVCYRHTFDKMSEQEYFNFIKPIEERVKKKGYVLISKDYLGNCIQELLDSRGITASDLSKKTGISKQSMSQVIRNAAEPSVSFALKVAKVLKVPVESVFSLEESAWYTIAKNEKGLTLYYDNDTDNVVSIDEINKDSCNRYFKLGEKVTLMN